MKNYPFFVEVSIREQIPPDERERRYAEPLSRFLESKSLGIITGGGTSVSARSKPDEKDILHAVLDVHLANLNSALTFAKQKLLELGIPAGSEFSYTDAAEVTHTEPIGELELLLVFIDNESLPQHIYDNVDSEKLFEGLRQAFLEGNVGELRGPCIWPSEVLIYFAGKDADEMFTRIQQLPKTFPILQNARIVFQRKNEVNVPQNLRLPFND